MFFFSFISLYTFSSSSLSLPLFSISIVCSHESLKLLQDFNTDNRSRVESSRNSLNSIKHRPHISLLKWHTCFERGPKYFSSSRMRLSMMMYGMLRRAGRRLEYLSFPMSASEKHPLHIYGLAAEKG